MKISNFNIRNYFELVTTNQKYNKKPLVLVDHRPFNNDDLDTIREIVRRMKRRERHPITG